MSRFWFVPLLLAIMVIVPFVFWGDRLSEMMAVDAANGRFGTAPFHAGLVGIILLSADLVLPIPTTSIIAGLGILFGPLVGTAYAFAGSLLAAILGYGIGRIFGRPVAVRWIGDSLAGGERAFARYGGWIVAASRWLPVMPEVISVSAGLTRMPLRIFVLAAACGSLPHCVLFAVIGHLGSEAPFWTLLISAVVPFLLWLIVEWTGLSRRIVGGGGN